MKKLMLMACAAAFMVACNNQAATTTTTAAAADTLAAAEKIDYAYLPENHAPDYWDRGDQKNVALVLKALKDYSTGDLETSLTAFADSVHWAADGIEATISKDSLRAMFKETWANISSVKIKMDDYEAVISKDKKEQFVTLWYKEIITDKKGKIDSLACVDDAKIEKGKIVLLDEKQRKFPAKK